MANIKTAISIEKPIFEQMNVLAKDLNISRSRLFALAAQEFIERHKNIELLQLLNQAYDDLPEPEPIMPKMRSRHYNMVKKSMVINQGDVFWIEFNEPSGSEPGYRHPHVVIQNNLFNRSRVNTVLVCTLTSNLKRSDAPGNVTLNKGEANLPKKKCGEHFSDFHREQKRFI